MSDKELQVWRNRKKDLEEAYVTINGALQLHPTMHELLPKVGLSFDLFKATVYFALFVLVAR